MENLSRVRFGPPRPPDHGHQAPIYPRRATCSGLDLALQNLGYPEPDLQITTGRRGPGCRQPGCLLADPSGDRAPMTVPKRVCPCPVPQGSPPRGWGPVSRCSGRVSLLIRSSEARKGPAGRLRLTLAVLFPECHWVGILFWLPKGMQL